MEIFYGHLGTSTFFFGLICNSNKITSPSNMKLFNYFKQFNMEIV